MKMTRLRVLAVMAAAATLSCWRACWAAQPTAFDGAKWIWLDSAQAGRSPNAPAGAAYFRAALAVPDHSQVRSAELILTADNLFTAHLNGRPIGESETDAAAWRRPKRFDVSGLVQPGKNVLAIEAVNTIPGAAGLLVRLQVKLADGSERTLLSNGTWKSSGKEEPSWERPAFDDQRWPTARIIGPHGIKPWGVVAAGSPLERPGPPAGKVRQLASRLPEQPRTRAAAEVVESPPPAEFAWPQAIVFVGDDCSLYRRQPPARNRYDSLNVTVFTARKSRAFPEHDLPAPIKVGRKLYMLKPAQPGARPRLLLDVGKGGIGSPSVSFDGRWIYFSMAGSGESFFHVYRIAAEGGEPQRLTDGPFHDIDPAELPDGRIVFISTRTGTFEEYHCPPSRALFVMKADGRGIRPITQTIIFDNEPRVLPDGRVLLIRSDNFFDRGKVETLLHAIHTDGTHGYTEFGLDFGPEYGGRLRAFLCGSPAPLPDGQVAFVSGPGITVGRPGQAQKDWRHFRVEAGDVAALPDGRLLCTVARKRVAAAKPKQGKRAAVDFHYERIAILDPAGISPRLTVLYESSDGPLHSPVYLGARVRPPLVPEMVDRILENDVSATGVLFCQNARFTRNTTAGLSHVRAMRVLAGKGLTTRSSHSYIVHAGSEVIELGTVPLAADGSFAVRVPADTPIAFQAVDAEGRSELNEMSWISVRPGEHRGCVGCHQPRQAAPVFKTAYADALRTPPLKLTGQGRPHRFRGNNAAVTGLMELQFDRFREVAGIDRHSETAGAVATGAEEAAALMERLRGDDDGLKVSAAQRLAILRDRAAAPALAARLNDLSREASVASALALAACGKRESVNPLLSALWDHDPLVSQAAAVALENLVGHAEPFNAFAPLAERKRQAARWSQWITDTGWDKIEQDLIARLQSGDRDAARRAAVALGHVGGDAARAALRQYVARQRLENPLPDWRKTHRGDGTRFNALSPVNPRTLQAATRSLGYLQDAEALPLLAETLACHCDPDSANLFLAEAAIESLGRIGTPEAQSVLAATFARLKEYPKYTSWYGDHAALVACHASPLHYLTVESLDAVGYKPAAELVPHLIRALPTDPDRALLLENDDCETLVGRAIRRSGAEGAVVETCLAILGDSTTKRHPEIEAAISTTYSAWAGKPDPVNRAAQVLSSVCRDKKYEPQIRAAFDRHRAKPCDIPRVFDTGIPRVQRLPVRHWVCFYLARALGNLADRQSVDSLVAAIAEDPAEAAAGRPDPLGPGVLFLHNDLTPCWRAAAAWALGRIGDRRAVRGLLKVVGDLENATDTRHAAAVALGRIAGLESLASIQAIAADYPEVSTRRALMEASKAISGRNAAHP